MNIDVSSLRLPDDAFWQSGAKRSRDPIVRKFKTTYFGVLIDAPHEVVVSQRSTLPLFAYYMGSYQQVATREFPDEAVLVVVDPDRNELRVASAMAGDGERMDAPGTSRAEEIPEGFLAKISEVDVRDRVTIPWQPSRLISQIILLDLNSNRVETKLTGGTGAFIDPEKEKFLAAERAKMDPPAPYPVMPATAYVATPDSPPLPESMGISLSAPRVAVLDHKQKVELRGSWRLPLAPEDIVKPANTEYNKTHGLIQQDGFTPYAACVRIHLLVVGSRQGSPYTYRLQLPVARMTEEDGKPVASGRFTIDLSALPDFPVMDQTMFIYSYARNWSSEPAVLGLVDRRPQ